MSVLSKQVGGDHYNHLSIQPAEYCTKNNLGFLEGNVVKYVTRHVHKGGGEDIDKAIHCLELLNKFLYNTESSPPPPATY